MSETFLGKGRWAAFCLCAMLLSSGAAAGQGQEPPGAHRPAELELQFQADGMTGTCRVDGESASLDARRLSKDSARSRLRRQDGRSVVEVLRDKETVEISFPGLKVKVDTATQTFVNFTEEDKEKLQHFLRSGDASLARRCITNLIQAKAQTDARKFLPLGFIMAAMLLGEESPAPGAQSNVAPLQHLLYANYGVRTQVAAAKPALLCPPSGVLLKRAGYVRAGYQDNCPDPNGGCFGGEDCNGCCGVGCSDVLGLLHV